MIVLSKMQRLTKSRKNDFCLSVISSEVFICHLKTAWGGDRAITMQYLLIFFFFFACSNHARPSLIAQLVKNPPAMWETWVWTLGWEDPQRRERLPTPVFWPGEFHGLHSPWGHRELNTTEWLSLSTFYWTRKKLHLPACTGAFPCT